MSLADIERRLRALEDVEEIKRLKASTQSTLERQG